MKSRSACLQKMSLEDLPNELLLSIFSYLKPVEIFCSFLNLNSRFYETLRFYRENIFLCHLSRSDFNRLTDIYLPELAADVRSLTINDDSSDHIGDLFEKKFHQIDQQFPRLEKLFLNKIEIETLENLSWRLNVLSNLHEINIQIVDDRMKNQPAEFNSFLCGKLFSTSNSFSKLTLIYDGYGFKLDKSIYLCKNLRSVTISINGMEDLFILFDSLPNIQELNVTMNCKSVIDKNDLNSRSNKLWWKAPSLKIFRLSIVEKSLSDHSHMFPSDVLFDVITNIYDLREIRFSINVEFNLLLRQSTTNDIFIETYFPYVDGKLWETAFKRIDNRKIRLDIHVEIDGCLPYSFPTLETFASYPKRRRDETPLARHIAATFQTNYWLKQNVQVEYVSSDDRQISVYSIPIRQSNFKTKTSTLEEQNLNSSKTKHVCVRNLLIDSLAANGHNPLLISSIFAQYPYLTALQMNGDFFINSKETISSTRLRCLTLNNCPSIDIDSLQVFPKLKRLQINFRSGGCLSESIEKKFPNIIQLRLSTNVFLFQHFCRIIEQFPNLKEFSLNIQDRSSLQVCLVGILSLFEKISMACTQIQYIETTIHLVTDRNITEREIDRLCPIPTTFKRILFGQKIRFLQWL